MYTFESTVRYSECDRTGKLNIYKIIDYFQDCSTFQSEELDIGVSHLHETGLAWVVSTWNIEVRRLPEYCEKIIIGTAPYDVKGFFGMRNFVLKTVDGETLVTADSLWTMLNLKEGKPSRVPKDVIDGYELAEKLPMTYIRSRIVIPKELAECESVRITKSFLDSNGHVNNARYVNIALDCTDVSEYSRVRVEYHRQAFPGDILVPKVGRNESGDVVVICDRDGNKYCVMLFE